MDAMTSPVDPLRHARQCVERRAWAEAYACLAAAQRAGTLEPCDVERLAMVANLVGRDAESLDHLAQAHQGWLRAGDVEAAARCAFWLGFRLQFQGEHARAGGWLARARRLLDDAGLDCALRGYLLLPVAIRGVAQGDAAGAFAVFGDAVACGERFGDAVLVTFARHGQGRALIRQGRVAEGVTLLDEAMVAVTADELPPDVVGSVYCSVLSACHEIADLRRAQEWTAALDAWCATQPDLVAYRGECLLRRAELLQLHGAWADALQEARRACARLADARGDVAAVAFYQCGELHRLRGEPAEAEAAYREANRRGRDPQPGLALLRLAQGDADAARAAVAHALEAVHDAPGRARLLAAAVEIRLATGEVPAARANAEALAELAACLDAPMLRALAAQALGAVLLAEGESPAAVAALREASALWRELDAPYEAARAGVLLAQARHALGDGDAARLELEAARETFARLGAAADLARLRRHAALAPAPGGLTSREVEVLRLLATGRTNRAIAGELAISEKTVARHVANIFTKLALTSRAAATAYAFRHELVQGD